MKRLEAGFSIIELMVSVAIGTIMLLSMASVMADWYRHSRASNANLVINDFATEVKYVMQNQEVCTATFSGISFDTASELDSLTVVKSVDNLRKGTVGGSSENWISANDPIKDGVILAAIGLTQFSVIDGPNGRFRGLIRLQFDRGAGTPGGPIRIVTVPLQLGVSYSGTMATTVNCSSLMLAGIDLSELCASMGGTWNATTGICTSTLASTYEPINVNCPAGQVMTGLTSSGVRCMALPTSVLNPGGYTPASPGVGCVGPRCRAIDFGPCSGSECVTNGSVCTGSACSACAPTASCSGPNCCTGPTCPGC